MTVSVIRSKCSEQAISERELVQTCVKLKFLIAWRKNVSQSLLMFLFFTFLNMC